MKTWIANAMVRVGPNEPFGTLSDQRIVELLPVAERNSIVEQLRAAGRPHSARAVADYVRWLRMAQAR
jgi:hypothetical protein